MLSAKLSTTDPLINTIYSNSVTIPKITDMFPFTILQRESSTDIRMPTFSLAKF